jgi:hypothetical protein
MPEKIDPGTQGDNPPDSSIPPRVKAYIDAEIEKAREHEADTHKKKWKNSWRAASPITKGSFYLTSGIAVATIAYAIIAGRQLAKMSGQLETMNETYREIHRQTKASEWSEYMACLNAQAAQSTFIQGQNSAIDSHTAAIATVEQATAGIEAQRAIIDFLPMTPLREEQIGDPLTLPFSIRNEGKSIAVDVSLHFKALLLSTEDTLHIDDKNFSGMHAHYVPAGSDWPGKSNNPNYQSIVPRMTVRDSEGKPVSTSSKEVQNFWDGGNKLVVVYGNLRYSDFAGTYKVTFCSPMHIMNPGTVREPTALEQTCANYNRQQNKYRILPTIDSPSPITASQLKPITCQKPSE